MNEPLPVPHPHRGRVQAQGAGLEKSQPWGRDTPLPRADGHDLLSRLAEQLTARELKARADALELAHEEVNRAASVGGVPQDRRYPYAKTFPPWAGRDEPRVDIEVHAGLAFVP